MEIRELLDFNQITHVVNTERKEVFVKIDPIMVDTFVKLAKANPELTEKYNKGKKIYYPRASKILFNLYTSSDPLFDDYKLFSTGSDVAYLMKHK